MKTLRILVPSILAFMLSGCFLLDPLNKSTKALEETRSFAEVEHAVVAPDEIFRRIPEIALVNKWTVFQQFPKRRLIVLIDIPGFVNSTKTGVFVTAAVGGGSKIEVCSQSWYARHHVARVLAGALDKPAHSMEKEK